MLTPKQVRAAQALARCRNVRSACRFAGCSERAFRKWVATSEEFRDAIRRCQRDLWGTSNFDLKGLSRQATRVIAKCLRSDNEDRRLRVAMWLLQFNMDVHKDLELAERMAALEARLAERDKGHATYMNGHQPAAPAAERNA
jgi:hypothetical protein